MKEKTPIVVFGEALFDCFPSGQNILGGAAFNVAWHLQALGDNPRFISCVGNDGLGQKVLTAMTDWGMDTQSIQIDPIHQTGQVEVDLIENEPHYNITPDCAYDFISQDGIGQLPDRGILYHGTLGVRNNISRDCLEYITKQSNLSVFLDVNLRSPWWQKQAVFEWLQQARWVKLNESELQQLGFVSTDICEAMHRLLTQFQLEQLIVTRGEKGVVVLEENGNLFQETPAPVDGIIDTVGAGDGFSAVFIHGLITGRPIAEVLNIAQEFAGKVITLRGATTKDHVFYQEFLS